MGKTERRRRRAARRSLAWLHVLSAQQALSRDCAARGLTPWWSWRLRQLRERNIARATVQLVRSVNRFSTLLG